MGMEACGETMRESSVAARGHEALLELTERRVVWRAGEPRRAGDCVLGSALHGALIDDAGHTNVPERAVSRQGPTGDGAVAQSAYVHVGAARAQQNRRRQDLGVGPCCGCDAVGEGRRWRVGPRRNTKPAGLKASRGESREQEREQRVDRNSEQSHLHRHYVAVRRSKRNGRVSRNVTAPRTPPGAGVHDDEDGERRVEGAVALGQFLRHRHHDPARVLHRCAALL